MRIQLQLLIGIIAMTCCSLAQAQTCVDTSHIFKFKYHGKKYEIVKEMKSWDSAAACAARRGGYLVQINSQQEQDSIYYAITVGATISSTYTTVMDGGGKAYVWIGATDKQLEGKWLWDGNNDNTGVNFWNGQGDAGSTGGGSAVGGAYNHWGGSTAGVAQEPDDYGSAQDAAAICLTSWPYGIAGEWNDINATNVLYYVIEYDSTTAINNVQASVNEKDITLYPNPAINEVRIYYNSAAIKITDITICNQVGAVVLNSKENTINTSTLPTGFYIIAVNFEDGSRVLKTLILK